MLAILADFLTKTDKGYYCRYGNFYIDAMAPVAVNLISHAHGDHATAGHELWYASKATIAFMWNKYRKLDAQRIREVDFDQPFEVNGVTIEFITAGHILG